MSMSKALGPIYRAINAGKISSQNNGFGCDPLVYVDTTGKRRQGRSTMYEATNMLLKLGYTLLGTGAYSTVWTTPLLPGRVIKVSTSTRDGFHQYAEMMLSRGRLHGLLGTAALQVFHAERYCGVGIYVCELLPQEMEYEEGDDALVEALTEFLYRCCPGDCRVDFHSGNRRRRADDTLVVSDPFAHYHDGSTNYGADEEGAT